MPHPAGAIIVASILIAAGIAAYESDNIRAWVEKTKQKIVTGFDAFNNEFNPKRPIPMRVVSNDASMTEEKGDAAEAKREQMRAQIAQRARVLEERSRKKRRPSTGPKSPSFDSLVDEDGKLRSQDTPQGPLADSTAVETNAWEGELRSRHQTNAQSTGDISKLTGQLPVTQQNVADLEREMRSTFNIPMPDRNVDFSSRASESLLDLTPTTEDFPDPDYSVPSLLEADTSNQRSAYFSATASASSHTLSDAQPEYYYAHPSRPLEPLARHAHNNTAAFEHSVSSAPSVAGSTSIVHPSEAEMSEDDLLSEPDGIRTPASAWTEVGSQMSGDDRFHQ